jgi:phytoene synthase
MREDVENLYAFVRIADDCVDEQPQDPERLRALEHAAVTGNTQELNNRDRIITDAYREVARRYAFPEAWITAFFTSMRQDLTKTTYATLEDTLTYTYGSAEVIGLMMARIMGAPEHAQAQAAVLGRAFQYINMLRDIGVDQTLGRTYIPQAILATYGLDNLSEEAARRNPTGFTTLMDAELKRYRAWQEEGMRGIPVLPFTARLAVRTACNAFTQTADVLERDPWQVYRSAYKPSKIALIWQTLTNAHRT